MNDTFHYENELPPFYYTYICTVDIKGYLDFIFRRVHNKFLLGLISGRRRSKRQSTV